MKNTRVELTIPVMIEKTKAGKLRWRMEGDYTYVCELPDLIIKVDGSNLWIHHDSFHFRYILQDESGAFDYAMAHFLADYYQDIVLERLSQELSGL